MAKRVIGSDKATLDNLLGIVSAGRKAYAARAGAPDSADVAFMAGIAFALKIATEINVPWIARNVVSEVGDEVARMALQRRG